MVKEATAKKEEAKVPAGAKTVVTIYHGEVSDPQKANALRGHFFVKDEAGLKARCQKVVDYFAQAVFGARPVVAVTVSHEGLPSVEAAKKTSKEIADAGTANSKAAAERWKKRQAERKAAKEREEALKAAKTRKGKAKARAGIVEKTKAAVKKVTTKTAKK